MSDSASLFVRPLVPVASVDDAAATAEAVLPRVAAVGGRARFVHVVEKAGGAPDKASVEQREAVAAEAFAAVRERADELGVDVEADVLYATDVADGIIDDARDVDATAIVFVPRGGNWLVELLTGGVRDDLVTRSDRPVVALPDPRTEAGT